MSKDARQLEDMVEKEQGTIGMKVGELTSVPPEGGGSLVTVDEASPDHTQLAQCLSATKYVGNY